MALILLVLQIIASLPAVIKVIGDIIALIRELRGPEKRAALADLTKILTKHKNCQDPEGCQIELEQLHSNIRNKYGI